jgi:hypothetical protein
MYIITPVNGCDAQRPKAGDYCDVVGTCTLYLNCPTHGHDAWSTLTSLISSYMYVRKVSFSHLYILTYRPGLPARFQRVILTLEGSIKEFRFYGLQAC